MKSKTQLVQTITKDDLLLTGLYSKGSQEKEAIVYIHGFEGDFFSNSFLHELADGLNQNKYAFVLAQNRGTGQRSEIKKSSRSEAVNLGAYYEKLDDAHLDISAWIDFLKKQGYSKFILIGHSLGTLKVTQYLIDGEYKDLISKLILFAPFDKNGYVENKTKGKWHEHVKIAAKKIKDGKALEFIPDAFDDYPMTYQTYHSWYKENENNLIWDFYRAEYLSPVLKKINIPVQVIIGDKDKFFYTSEIGGSFEKSHKYLKKNIKKLQFYKVVDSGHTYLGHEKEVANKAISFIQS